LAKLDSYPLAPRVSKKIHSRELQNRFIRVAENIFLSGIYGHNSLSIAKKQKRIDMKTKLLSFIALLVLSCMPNAYADSALNEVLDSGMLKVGTTGDWDPLTTKDITTNGYKGFDIDIMTQLAEDMGVKVEFVPADWKTIVNGITSGKYHLTGSASVSPARAKAAGFSLSYFSVNTVPLILKKNADKYKDWDDLNKTEVIMAATLGTTQESQVKSFFPEATHHIVEAPARDFQEVLSGKADGNITSNIEATKLVNKYPQLMIVPVSKPKAPTPIAMLLPQQDQIWINYINTWITLQKSRGFFDELAQKWKLTN
jgi:cyclohexadienyl dehydratase